MKEFFSNLWLFAKVIFWIVIVTLVITFIFSPSEFIETFSPSKIKTRREAKYEISVEDDTYYVNSYTYTNNVLTFHEVSNDYDMTFAGKSFKVKPNN